MERKILSFWRDNRIFQKLRAQNAAGPRWSFLDGPITANNPMGVHHAWGRSLQGHVPALPRHERPGAALPERLRLPGAVGRGRGREGASASKPSADIRDYGIDEFVRACKERVLTFAARQTEQSIRLGYWMDWDDPAVLLALRDALAAGDRTVTATLPSGLEQTARASEIVRKLGSGEYGGSYFTFSDENNYTIWAFLQKCHDEGFIYRGHDVMPWCGALRHRPLADGDGRRPAHHHAHVGVRAFPAQGPAAHGLAGVDHDAVDADLQRRRGREPGDDLSEGAARRVDLLRGQGELRARPRAGPASGRQARDAPAALDSYDPQGQRQPGRARRAVRALTAGPRVRRPVRRAGGRHGSGRRRSPPRDSVGQK